MGNKTSNWSWRAACLFLIALVAAFLVPVGASSAEDKVANPGQFTAKITGGDLQMRDLELDLGTIDPAPTLTGNIDKNGNIVIPSSGVNFPPLLLDFDGQVFEVFIRPSGSDWTGQLDPEGGLFSLNARLRVQVVGTYSGLSINCYAGATGTGNNLWLNPASSGDIPANGSMSAMSGRGYDEDTGETRVVNNTISVPGFSGCGPLNAGDGIINNELGLPSASGNNSLALNLEFTDNKPVRPINVKYTADPESGRVPFDVDFDASSTVSNVGPIDEYRWDFDGDGSVDKTTVEPTVTHTYEVAASNQTALTVVSGPHEIKRSRVTVTARSIVTSFTERPPVSQQSRDASFSFTANEVGATFSCQLLKNGNPFPLSGNPGDPVPSGYESCTSPVSFTGLEDADYTLNVRATSAEDGATGLPAVGQFRIDNINPVAQINSKPANFVNGSVTSGSVAFSANEPGTFECRFLPTKYPVEPVEGEEPVEPQFEACESPADVSWDPVEGTNTFEVRPTDLAGNVGNVVSTSWQVDLTPPTTNITYSPNTPTNQIGGNYAEECFAGFLVCLISPVYTEVTSAGNTAQRFDFAGSEAGTTYICQWNNEGERPCNPGIQTGTGVAAPGSANQDLSIGQRRLGTVNQGPNTLRIWSTDQAGNRQTNPTVFTLVYDTVAPVITALAKPADFTKSVNNTVIFSANETVQTNSFQCRFINNAGATTTAFATGTGAPTGFVPCDPGQLTPTMGWYSVSGQTEGRKGVQVRATDLAGNVLNTNNNVLNNGGLTVYWTVDNTAPVATFAAGSQQQNSYTTNTNATINLSATDTPINFGTAANGIDAQQPAYECSLNGAPFSACSTPINLTGLTPGAKSYRVRVTDKATNVSAIIERNWTVVNGTNASVNLTSTPSAVMGSRNATYEFTPSSGTSQCRIDPNEAANLNDSGWVSCTSPHTFPSLADGNHQVEIRANSTAIPAVHNFAVYANVPTVTVGGLPGIVRNAGRFTGLDQDSAAVTLSSAANPVYAPGATTFECRYFQVGDVAGPWEACASPFNVNWDKQDHQSVMRLEVRPVSSTGNTGAQVDNTWTIDAERPEVSLGAPAIATACGRGVINGPGPSGCVATNVSSQPWIRTSVTNPQFRATSTEPVVGAVGFACQLNGGVIQNPCTGRTSSLPATGNPLTVIANGTARSATTDNLGNAAQGGAVTSNASNTMRIWAVDNGGNLSEEPATYTFVQDSVVPGFAITSPTPSRTNAGTAEKPLSVDIAANEDMHPTTGITCRLIVNGNATSNPTSPGANPPASPANGAVGTWTTCPMDLVDPDDPDSDLDLRSASWSADNLAEGNYALHIRGWDTVWNVATSTNAAGRPTESDNSVNGRAYIFTIDRTAPVVNITGGPADGSTVPSGTGEFVFAPNEPAGQIDKTECRLDPADAGDLDTAEWENCSGSFAYEDLADGQHTFQVRSLDTAGNQGNVTTRTWTVDSTMPVIDLSSNLNGGITNQTSVNFTFTVNPVDSSLECRLFAPDGYPAPDPDVDPEPAPEEPPFAACTSPVAFADMIDGEYTFEVKATNTLGTVGENVTRTWTVDTVAPVATIGAKPAATTNNPNAAFTFSADKSGSTFKCDLDGNVANCESPAQFNALNDGSHTLKVQATDPAGNTSAWVEHNWLIDTVAPVTTINSGPSGTEQTRSASLEFGANKAGSTFECRKDAANWSACTSPVALTGLSNGLHEFRIRATDTLGNVGPVETRTWAVNVEACPPGQIGDFPDCTFPPCPEGQIGTPPNCEDPPCPTGTTGTPPNCVPDPCPVGTTGTPPNCVPDTCPTGQIGTPPNCENPPPTVCVAPKIGNYPNCVTPKTADKATDSITLYNPKTGKLSIRLKCPAAFKPKCQGTAVAVTGKGKKAKAMSSKVKNASKAGGWKLVTITIKPAFRQRVAKMTATNKKQLIVKQTLKSKKAKKRTVFHTYMVRVKG